MSDKKAAKAIILEVEDSEEKRIEALYGAVS